ncbi:hypothetical protein [Agreia sp. Leaf244]|nr:hypothetical protein [Agreia sp. Leaf244]
MGAVVMAGIEDHVVGLIGVDTDEFRLMLEELATSVTPAAG